MMKKTYKKDALQKILADTLSPVSIYLKIRDNLNIFESSDYHGNDNSFPIYAATQLPLQKHGNTLTKVFPDSTEESYRVENNEVTSEYINLQHNLK